MNKRTFADLIKDVKTLGVTEVAYAKNFTSDNEVSSVHFFKGGIEIAYYMPCMLSVTNCNLQLVNRENPIDYPNAFPLKDWL